MNKKHTNTDTKTNSNNSENNKKKTTGRKRYNDNIMVS